MDVDLTINGFDLVKTCGACPEQYDVFSDGVQVGYMRIRNGGFSVDCPDVGGSNVFYSNDIEGDGCFDSDERERFLTLGCNAIRDWHYKLLLPVR